MGETSSEAKANELLGEFLGALFGLMGSYPPEVQRGLEIYNARLEAEIWRLEEKVLLLKENRNVLKCIPSLFVSLEPHMNRDAEDEYEKDLLDRLTYVVSNFRNVGGCAIEIVTGMMMWSTERAVRELRENGFVYLEGNWHVDESVATRPVDRDFVQVDLTGPDKKAS